VFAEGVLDPPMAVTAAVPGVAATRAMSGTTVIPASGTTTSAPATIPAAEELPPPRRTGWLVAVTLILLAALGLGLFALARSLGIGDGASVAIPDVQNQPALIAKNLLSARGFNVDSGIEYAYSRTVAFNNVIDTKPSVGSKVAKNSLVTLVVSAGPPVTVPANAIGADASAVTSFIQQQNSNIKITPTYAANNNFDQGKIINTNPPPGQQPRAGDGVTLMVSSGPSSKVPDVRGLDAGQAAGILTGAGYQVGQTATQYSQSANGVVLATNPNPNTPLRPGSTVNLLVSLGPPPTTTTTTTAPTTTTTTTTRPTTTTTTAAPRTTPTTPTTTPRTTPPPGQGRGAARTNGQQGG
jgi:serine/threonine-protein kinase